jgi:hypothetical protein
MRRERKQRITKRRDDERTGRRKETKKEGSRGGKGGLKEAKAYFLY